VSEEVGAKCGGVRTRLPNPKLQSSRSSGLNQSSSANPISLSKTRLIQITVLHPLPPHHIQHRQTTLVIAVLSYSQETAVRMRIKAFVSEAAARISFLWRTFEVSQVAANYCPLIFLILRDGCNCVPQPASSKSHYCTFCCSYRRESASSPVLLETNRHVSVCSDWLLVGLHRRGVKKVHFSISLTWMVEALCYKPEGNTSSRTMAMRCTQPLVKISARGKARPACRADNLTAICEPIV
jgi:hypothetical protein